MSTLNPAPTQAPVPAPAVRRSFKTWALNFALGNPVRAGIACIVLFWIPLYFFLRG